MPAALYDSGWVPVASGSISAVIDNTGFEQLHVIYASSGSNPATSASLFWVAGGDFPIPQGFRSAHVPYPTDPKVTGTLSVTSSTDSSGSTDYVLSGYNTASLTRFVPMEIGVRLLAGSASWARIIVEGV